MHEPQGLGTAGQGPGQPGKEWREGLVGGCRHPSSYGEVRFPHLSNSSNAEAWERWMFYQQQSEMLIVSLGKSHAGCHSASIPRSRLADNHRVSSQAVGNVRAGQGGWG